MRNSYIDYAMSVIVSRALPDARDGLKPVQRRILYAMDELALGPNNAYKKCARIVGEVLGKYHPHGDSAVYDALVRMAQGFSLRYPLVDGQGNFGSVDNDPPAAMRYTEARLSRIAQEALVDLDRDTVDFSTNFDDSLQEPLVLPARLPSLLVNGASGIAVGMATNIPPHNLTEICDGVVRLIDNPDSSVDDLISIITGPDFPTSGIIMGHEGIYNAYHTGHGKVVIRARTEIVEGKGGREQIIVSELPYQTNKAALVEKIADLIKDKRLDGISEIRDESDREGMRIAIELKRDSTGEQVLNNLYQQTALQSSFFVNMLALVDGQPRVLNLRQALSQYIDFRREVVTRRSQFDLNKARERAHVLEGLIKALDNLDAVIQTIRESDDVETARANLIQTYDLSQIQAQAILDMQLRRLAALERQRILDENQELQDKIAFLEDLLGDPVKIIAVVRQETATLKDEYGDKRSTEISDEEARGFTNEELIPHLDVVVSISNRNYAKRLPIDAYRIQRRGGHGVRGMITREQDVVQHLLMADTHDHLLFFTNRGRVIHSKAYRIPQEQTRAAKGTPLVNLIPLTTEEMVTAVVSTKDFDRDQYLMLCTKNGRVKRTQIGQFNSAITRTGGIIAMNLQSGDELVSVRIVEGEDHVVAVTEQGQAIRFPVVDVRPQLRNAGGVRGMRLSKGDRVLDMERVREGAFLLVVSEKGLGKLTKVENYPTHHRGGAGVKTINITDRTGPVAAARMVNPTEELMIISKEGIMLRTTLQQVRVTGRAAQGVRVMNVDGKDSVASITCFESQPDDDPEGEPKSPVTSKPNSKSTVNPTKKTKAEASPRPAEEGDQESETIDDSSGKLEPERALTDEVPTDEIG
ncbi:DNA gyrase subunit A [Dehalococcoidia bacterium]|nr:DNA gyrase subunit A [Dehalococcoidia bacterium]